MRFFAQNIDFIGARATERDLKGESSQHGDDRVCDFIGQAGKSDDRDWQSSGWDTKEFGDYLAKVVLNHQPTEHEPIARIPVEPLKSITQGSKFGAGKSLIEHAKPFLDHCDDVDDAIWCWRIGSCRIPLGD